MNDIIQYGTFDINQNPVKLIDIGSHDELFSIVNGEVIIRKDLKSFLSQKVSVLDNSYIRLRINNENIFIKTEDYLSEIHIKQHPTNKIIIVYNIFMTETSNWRAIISGQLLDMKCSGLLKDADLYVTITGKTQIGNLIQLINDICGYNVSINIYHENAYEYWGIKKAWELAHHHPTAIVGYLHSKGISYGIADRDPSERYLTRKTFVGWRKAMQLFEHSTINKVGLFPARTQHEGQNIQSGWIWYNFWWSRASYLAKCEEPKKTPNRYYYEEWLSFSQDESRAHGCFALRHFDTLEHQDTYFLPDEANEIMGRLYRGV